MKLTCSLQVDSRPLQGNFQHLIEYANESIGAGLSTSIMLMSGFFFFFLSYKLGPEYQREEEK